MKVEYGTDVHIECIILPLGNQSRQLLFHFQPGNFWGGEQICIPHQSVSMFLSGTVCRLLTSAIWYLWLGQHSKPWWQSNLDSVSFCEMVKSIQVPVIPKLLWKTPHVSLKISDKLLNEVQSKKQWGENYWQAVTHQSICPTWGLWVEIKACSVSSLAVNVQVSQPFCRHNCY